jgi:hypothetical protein
LVDNPDFSDLDRLSKQKESGTLKFIKDVERFLSKQSDIGNSRRLKSELN